MAVFHGFGVFRGVPPIWGLFLASCWRLAGVLLACCWLLLASCWPLPGLLLASSWPLAGFLLASSFPTRISLGNRFFTRLAKTVNSLHENGCFSMVSVFRGVPPIWGLLLASCWPLAGFALASCWPLAGPCWPLAGLLLASCSSFPTRISPKGFPDYFIFGNLRASQTISGNLGASQTISGHLKLFKGL